MRVLVLEEIRYLSASFDTTHRTYLYLFKDAESFLKYDGKDLPDFVRLNKHKLLIGLANVGLGEIEAPNGNEAYLYYQEVV